MLQAVPIWRSNPVETLWLFSVWVLAQTATPAEAGQRLYSGSVSFALIESLDAAARLPVQIGRFGVPAPGLLRVRIEVTPWYEYNAPVRFRAAGSEVWSDTPPGLTRSRRWSFPDPPMPGCALLQIDDYPIDARQWAALPRIEAALFASVVEFPGGSLHQFQNRMQLAIDWFETAPPPPAPDSSACSEPAAQ